MNLTSLFTPKVATAVAAVLIVFGGIGWHWWTTTPQYALSQIQKAYETHDTGLALKYIDFDAVFNNLWASIQAKMMQEVASTDNGFAALGAMFGQAIVQNMKPTIEENLRAQLLDSIKTGVTATSSIVSLSAHYSISHDGDAVIVSSRDSTIKLRLQKEDGVWHVVAVEGWSTDTGIDTLSATSTKGETMQPTKASTKPVTQTKTVTVQAVHSNPVSVKEAPVTPSVPTPTPAPAATWHTAYTYSGSQDHYSKVKTPTFALLGKKQKISYECSIVDPSNPFGGSFSGTVHIAEGYDGDFFASGDCPMSNSTYEYSLSPGDYYLDLNYVNASYKVTVEDLY